MTLSIAWLNRLLRLSAAAMLLAILVHATIPVGAPLERHSGSAFSATTSETTIDLGRSTQVRKLPAVKSPGGDPDPLVPVLLLAMFVAGTGPVAAVVEASVRQSPDDRRPRRLRPDLGSRAPPFMS